MCVYSLLVKMLRLTWELTPSQLTCSFSKLKDPEPWTLCSSSSPPFWSQVLEFSVESLYTVSTPRYAMLSWEFLTFIIFSDFLKNRILEKILSIYSWLTARGFQLHFSAFPDITHENCLAASISLLYNSHYLKFRICLAIGITSEFFHFLRSPFLKHIKSKNDSIILKMFV